MQLKLENLAYQTQAVQAVVNVFNGNIKNTAENANQHDIRQNLLSIDNAQIEANKLSTIELNGLKVEDAKLSNAPEICIEMETGTGKTLVYIRSIYELFKTYGFTKFIILVPSIAIRKGVISSFSTFQNQLEDEYGFTPKYFEYESKNLMRVTEFVQSQHPTVMVMTLASFNSEDKILNQAQREDLLDNKPFIEAIASTRPIIIMDEPQEGMDTENSIKNIRNLNPLIKIRYSATHKVLKNLLYRLTPFESYQSGLVKKIEVMSIVERNDEATIKIEIVEIRTSTADPQVKLKAWIAKNDTFEFKATSWLKTGDNLGEITKNSSYNNYEISGISKARFDTHFKVTFSNGAIIEEHSKSGNIVSIWQVQIGELVKMHFYKTKFLKAQGIKCLSLVFIDKVANYMGEEPIIKTIFIEKYRETYAEYNAGKVPSDAEIQAVQGYYFAQKANGEFADNEGGVKEQDKIYKKILEARDELLKIDEPIQFIFSHSALGVGWDNPNIFNIATLSNTYSEIKKRQEIGRGLRICVNQNGNRVRDKADVLINDRINLLTVFPNESYETFVAQYQAEIIAVYGNTASGADITKNDHGKRQVVTLTPNPNATIQATVKKFWAALARKTQYTVAFDEDTLIAEAVAKLNKISIRSNEIAITSNLISELRQDTTQAEYLYSASVKVQAQYAPLDIIEEISEQAGLDYSTVFKIIKHMDKTQFSTLIKNPPKFTQAAITILRAQVLASLLRKLEYTVTDEIMPFDFNEAIEQSVSNERIVDTPNKGVYDKMVIDSGLERDFALDADSPAQSEIVCFLKLPASYKIPIPKIFNQDAHYEPDFGIVLKQSQRFDNNVENYYFVVEVKGTNDPNDKAALTEAEKFKINCAIKHFKALGINLKPETFSEQSYIAPIKTFDIFKNQALNHINGSVQA